MPRRPALTPASWFRPASAYWGRHRLAAELLHLRRKRTLDANRRRVVESPNPPWQGGVDGSSPSEGSAKRRTSALLRSARLAESAPRARCGAVYGAFAWNLPLPGERPRDGRITPARERSYRRQAMHSPKPDTASALLPPLHVGDRLPWKLDHRGEPQWLTVVNVVNDMSYLVRYPDGKTQLLVDSE
jgi:hypothetical protein